MEDCLDFVIDYEVKFVVDYELNIRVLDRVGVFLNFIYCEY